MKKFSKIAAVVALMLVVCLSFTGCGNLGNAIISALSLDVTVDDPALIKVEDILDKTVKTESVKSGDFTYTLYTDNTACITGYTGSNPVVSIPAEIDGAKVVGLENKALKSSSTLKELILPDSVEAIGNYAAMYCDSLEKVTIGKNIKHIGISAFEGSQENAYTGKSKLTTVVFNGAPKTISEKAFYFCSALTEIVLPEGVETIGDWAFAKCFSAKKIIIPEGVTQIDDHAFLKCTGAVEISIPGTVESIAVSTFYRCSSLEKLTIGEGTSMTQAGFNFNTSAYVLLLGKHYQSGANLFDPAGTKALIDTDTQSADLDYLLSLYNDDKVGTPDFGPNSDEAFGQGLSAMTYNWGHYYGTLRDKYPDIEFGTFQTPVNTAGQVPYAYDRYNGESTPGINKNASDGAREVAQDFLTFFLTSDALLKDLCLHYSLFPSSLSLADNAEITSHPVMSALGSIGIS